MNNAEEVLLLQGGVYSGDDAPCPTLFNFGDVQL